jgi:hypothetical protein
MASPEPTKQKPDTKGIAGEIKPGEIQSVPQFTDQIAGPSLRAVDKSFSHLIKLFILPLAVVGIFALFLIGGILPNISEIFGGLDQVVTLNEQFTQKTDERKLIQEIAANESELDTQLESIKLLAGSENQSAVVLFQQKISKLALDSDLEVLGQTTGEKILNKDLNASATSSSTSSASPQTDQVTGLIEIPSEFTLEGKLEDIKRFIASLNTIDDFMIIGEVDLIAKQSATEFSEDLATVEWQLKINLLKYQFQPADSNNNLNQLFASIPLEAKIDQEILEFIQERQ